MNVLNKILIIFSFYCLTIFTINAQILQSNRNNSGNNNISSVLSIQLEKRIITIDTWAKFITYSIFEPAKLPPEYRKLKQEKLNTFILKEIFQNWDKLSKPTKSEIRKYGFTKNGALAPPSGLDSTKESKHFKFHFTISPGDSNSISAVDNNANGTPDYIDTMADIFEEVWNKEIDSMQYVAPPPDSTFGGNAKYDVFIFNFSKGLFGYVAANYFLKDNPNSTFTEKYAATSYMAMRNNYNNFKKHSELENIKVTAAHEFFHAVQFGYDFYAKAWLMEATATWIEDEIYDNINDNVSYLITWFKFPSYPLDATKAEFSNRWYGSWLFFRYISEHLSQNTIRKIWGNVIKHNNKEKDFSIVVIDDALKLKNSSFKETFKNFALSNLFKTIPPFNYEEAELYPSIKIAREIFQSKKNLKYLAKRHGARYFRIYPNAMPGKVDEIEFTLIPDDPNTELELIVATRNGKNVSAESSFLSGGVINFSLSESSAKEEIYAIVVNLDTSKTNYNLEITYKGNLVQLSSSGSFNYGQIASNYFIYRVRKDYVDSGGEARTDFIIKKLGLLSGYLSNITIPNAGGINAYLSKSGGDIFIIADDLISGNIKNYGYHFGSLIELNGQFQVTQFPAVEYNTAYFLGELYSTEFKKGIFVTNLTSGPPKLLLDLTDTDYTIDRIESDGNRFVAVKRQVNINNSDELIYYSNNSINTFYRPDSGFSVMNLIFNDSLVVWSERDDSFLNSNIKSFDFKANKVKSIRSNNYLDLYSVGSAAKKIVWWENNGAATQIKLWEKDSIKTIRKTFKGLYLDDNGVSSNSFAIPIDEEGIAWMENNFRLYYYHFKTASLNSYDLSNFFTDNLLTNYLVKLSGKNIIIEAISSINKKNVGIYLFKLGEILTDVKKEEEEKIPYKFHLTQNYPNPFNPTTTIIYEIPADAGVTLKIYDILGKEVAVLVNGKQKAGKYQINFNAAGLSSGVYFYRLSTIGKKINLVSTKKMLLLK